MTAAQWVLTGAAAWGTASLVAWWLFHVLATAHKKGPPR